MRVPWVRYKVWCLMAMVAAVALALGYLRRPYPTKTTLGRAEAGTLVGPWAIHQYWSDGRVQIIRPFEGIEPFPKQRRHYGPVLMIEWTDGTMSFYLDGQ